MLIKVNFKIYEISIQLAIFITFFGKNDKLINDSLCNKKE